MNASPKMKALEATERACVAALAKADDELVAAERARADAARAYGAEADAAAALPLLQARERASYLEGEARAKSAALAVELQRAREAIAAEQAREQDATAAAERARRLEELERLKSIASDASTRADVLEHAEEIHALKARIGVVIRRSEARLDEQRKAASAAVDLAAELGVDLTPDAPLSPHFLRFATLYRSHLADELPVMHQLAVIAPPGPSGLRLLEGVARDALGANMSAPRYDLEEQLRDLLAGTHAAGARAAHEAASARQAEENRRRDEREKAAQRERAAKAAAEREEHERAEIRRHERAARLAAAS